MGEPKKLNSTMSRFGLGNPAVCLAASRRPRIRIATKLRSSPPLGRRVQVEGYVIHSYLCPPCPTGAQCKPCLMSTASFIADTKEHERFPWDDPPADVATIAVDDPAHFSPGVRYRFELQVPETSGVGDVDATLVRRQRADAPPGRLP